METLFENFELIDSYSRADMLADGTLVDVTGDESREAGLTIPVAMTAEAYQFVDPSPAEMDVDQSLSGRLWDVFWMLKIASAQGKGGRRVQFDVIVAMDEGSNDMIETCGFEVLDQVDSLQQVICRFIAVVGPGDDVEPVMTIMLPGQD